MFWAGFIGILSSGLSAFVLRESDVGKLNTFVLAHARKLMGRRSCVETTFDDEGEGEIKYRSAPDSQVHKYLKVQYFHCAEMFAVAMVSTNCQVSMGL